jgi:hypothetical protein
MEFGYSLRNIGEPIYVPEWGTTVLRRPCGLDQYDAIGTYPITVFRTGCDLAAGLDRLARLGLVSIVLVVDSILSPELAALERVFDFTRAFKLHYMHDRNVPRVVYSKHHRYEVRRAHRGVRIERFNLADRLHEWVDLYRNLLARHESSTAIHAFPRLHHEILARLPGTIAIGAFADDRLVSCHLWVCEGDHAMSHLAASNAEGYDLRAAYAVNDASIELLAQVRTLNFGGGAGALQDSTSGLVRFKRGFANKIAPSYLCGKVLNADAYAELSREAGVLIESAYFPSYRHSPTRIPSSGMLGRG